MANDPDMTTPEPTALREVPDCPCGHDESDHVHYCSADMEQGSCDCAEEYVRLAAIPPAALDVERLARLAYADRPPLGNRPVPWTPSVKRDWMAWAHRIAAAVYQQEGEK